MVLLGLVTIRRSVRSWHGWITFAAGCVGMLATLALSFLFPPSETRWDAGTVERLAAYPLPLWLTWTGWLMRRERLG